ncbi:hypothetical protein [Pseudomonas sp. CGJS7]|uniref:hypothetical protein n=1 Tax=Pseudomonas sp. CGJS7 TaxID=3109348 RepID=UPI0030085DAA
MLRVLLVSAIAIGFCGSTPTFAQANKATSEARQEAVQKNQQKRLQAITRRGRLTTYEQLLGTSKVRIASSASASETASRSAAIDLAALGFTAADVQAYKKRNINLFDVAHRFFEGVTSSSEAMLMADTVVVATAGQVQAGRSRSDGFLSETPFTVVKSLRGSRAPSDVILVPSNSGPLPNGSYRTNSSDTTFTAGKKYLLVLSKNWYEQFVALSDKRSESNFTALPYDAYEVADNGTLLRRSHSMQADAGPKDLRSVEVDLSNLPRSKSKMGGTQ